MLFLRKSLGVHYPEDPAVPGIHMSPDVSLDIIGGHDKCPELIQAAFNAPGLSFPGLGFQHPDKGKAAS
jgi:hypothetical protein